MGEQVQRAGHEIQTAACGDLVGGDFEAGKEMRGRVDDGGQQHGGSGTRLALDRGMHGAAEEGLLDECHGKPAQ